MCLANKVHQVTSTGRPMGRSWPARLGIKGRKGEGTKAYTRVMDKPFAKRKPWWRRKLPDQTDVCLLMKYEGKVFSSPQPLIQAMRYILLIYIFICCLLPQPFLLLPLRSPGTQPEQRCCLGASRYLLKPLGSAGSLSFQ